jgi:hypothetical protein
LLYGSACEHPLEPCSPRIPELPSVTRNTIGVATRSRHKGTPRVNWKKRYALSTHTLHSVGADMVDVLACRSIFRARGRYNEMSMSCSLSRSTQYQYKYQICCLISYLLRMRQSWERWRDHVGRVPVTAVTNTGSCYRSSRAAEEAAIDELHMCHGCPRTDSSLESGHWNPHVA